MAVFLNEAQAGCDQELIGFPHLLLCMGVVLQTKAWLYGYHFDAAGDTGAHAAGFATFITDMGGDVANGVHLYGCANWRKRYHGGGRQAWKTDMQKIANALGYHGRVSGFDTSIIGPEQGTFVEYIPEFRQERCHIFYKRNEKMDFTDEFVTGRAIPEMASFKLDHTGQTVLPRTGSIQHTISADIQVTPSNKGRLHELNYFLRLVSFNV